MKSLILILVIQIVRENHRMQKSLKQISQIVSEITLDDLLKYPQLQKRISSKQFQISAIHNMITSLRGETIDSLKKQFISCSNCVNLEQFVWLMSNCLQFQQFQISQSDFSETFTTVISQKPCLFTLSELKKYELEYELIKIFEDIDIDESASITWEQFIEYITCISLTQIQNTGNDTQRQNTVTFKNQENSMKEVEFTHNQKALFRKNSIGKIVELERHGKLAIVEKKSGNLNFININGSIPGKPLELANVDYSKVLSIDYSEDDRIFGLLMNNHRVVFIEDGQMQKNHGENKFSGDQIQIMYLRIHKLWLLICMDQSIHIFKPPKGRSQATNSHKLLLSFIPHSLPRSHFLKNNKGGANIIGIKQSMNPFGLYTGSINGQIKIWSLEKNELLIKLQPCQEEISDNRHNSLKGFEVFNQKSVSYMISWIFTNQISVWLPSSSLAKAFLGKLRGHMGIVEDAKFLHNFPHVISIDNKASVRVWNIKKFQCIQNWRSQYPVRIFILKTIPFALFYDRLISFYKIKCEQEFQIVQKKMGLKTIVAPTQKPHQSSPSKQKAENLNKAVEKKIKKVSFENEQSNQHQGQGFFAHVYDIDKKDYIKQEDQIQIDPEIGQQSSTVIQVLYDDYYDCFLILSQEQLKEVSINNGKVLNKIEPKQKNQVFLAMCLKKHRRIFIANNLGQISLYRVEDGAKLFTLNVLNDNLNLEFRKHNGILNQQLEIYSIDYNIYNQVLLSVGSYHSQPLLTAYSPDLSRKKQIFFDQSNICSFCSAANYNVFYIASNSPEIITIWDYHNILPLKTIQLKASIKSINCQASIQNILIVTQEQGIRIFKFNGVQPRNTSTLYKESSNFLKSQIYLEGEDYERLIRSELVSYRKKIKSRQIKVAFADGTSQELNNKKNTSKIQEVIGLYVQTANKLIFIDLTNLLSLNEPAPPKKSNSPNIVKEEKFYDIIPVKYEALTHPKRVIQYQNFITQSITNVKQKLCKIGYVREMIYFSMVGMDSKGSSQSTGVINFYDYKDSVVRGKLSLPGGDIIFWNICITLSHKIFEKMLRAQKIACDVHSKLLVKNDGYFEKVDILRKVFLFKRYLTEDDIKTMRQFIAKNQKSYSNISEYLQFQSNSTLERNTKSSNILAEAIEEYQKKQEKKKLLGQNSIKKSVHHQMNQLQHPDSSHHIKKLRSQSFSRLRPGAIDGHKQKRKEIEQKYSEVFKYLSKKKHNNKGEDCQKNKKEESRGSTQNSFKIKMMGTAKSAQKMYKYQTKIANEFKNKIQILEWTLSNVGSNTKKTRLKL